ncbi:hypothetical protein B0H11DRAFT_1932708 [Mycena galericulata]|nr:hypothetical protein B0H11DRAFT_1932708 [Mycena galericulata]
MFLLSQDADALLLYDAVGAAHGVVQACRALGTVQLESAQYPVLAQHLHSMTLPSSLALFASPPARALFDAGVVCAYATLRHMWEVFSAGVHEALGGGGPFPGGGEPIIYSLVMANIISNMYIPSIAPSVYSEVRFREQPGEETGLEGGRDSSVS